MYSAKVLPILIASPSDVQTERNAIREVVCSWNYTDSFSKSLVVLPVGWETHSSPELGISAQDQISERLVDRCDVLVGIFWTKLGSPTGKEASGTVEEIKRHSAAGKPAMLYFSEKPVAQNTFDSEKWAELEKFKEWCKPQGLYWPFDSETDLKEKFQSHLRHCLNENTYVQGQIEKFSLIEDDVESGLKTVQLSREALDLLQGAIDGDGLVGMRSYLSGSHYSGGSFSQETSGSGREDAKWRAAVEMLENYGLTEERSIGSGLYYVTSEGFDAIERNADAINKVT
jgi:hypothetical protein